MTPPELIMLVGIPGCGKSTWIENFFATKPTRMYSILSSDWLVEQAAKECGVTYDVAHKLFTIEELMDRVYAKATYCTKNDRSIIWDQTNLTVEFRMKKLKMIPSHWHKKAVSFEVSLEVAQQRRIARELKNPGKTIPPEVLESMIAGYQRPTMEEGWDEILVINS